MAEDSESSQPDIVEKPSHDLKRWANKTWRRVFPQGKTEEPDVLSPDKTDLQDPIEEYVNRERYGEVPELRMGESVVIPMSDRTTITYTKKDFSWMTDRHGPTYDMMLFSDEFGEVDPHNQWKAARKDDLSEVIAGGKETALGKGRKVLDLGSGEAVGLLGYSLEFPETTFIGVDSGYDRTAALDLNKPGVQLTKDDWSTLETVPDSSIDTILSTQGAFTWGGSEVLQSITRVAKDGAILRFDINKDKHEENEQIARTLREHGWDVTFAPQSAVAIKQQVAT